MLLLACVYVLLAVFKCFACRVLLAMCMLYVGCLRHIVVVLLGLFCVWCSVDL